MLALERAHGVARLHLWTRLGRALGYTVSAYVARGVLVDTGFPHAVGELRAALRRLRPRAAIVTHPHEDHAGNAAPLAALGLPLVASAATLAALRAPGPLAYYRRMVWGTPTPLGAAHGTSDEAALDGTGLRILAAPGHTSDHVVVWDAERGHLFGGDLFLGVKVRVAHADEDPHALVRSLRRIAALEPAVLFDAHRGVVERPAPLLRAKADWLEETVAEMARLADAGLDARAIARQVLGPEPWVALGSHGAYAKLNLVRTALARRR